jgi:hypothetical protein
MEDDSTKQKAFYNHSLSRRSTPSLPVLTQIDAEAVGSPAKAIQRLLDQECTDDELDHHTNEHSRKESLSSVKSGPPSLNRSTSFSDDYKYEESYISGFVTIRRRSHLSREPERGFADKRFTRRMSLSSRLATLSSPNIDHSASAPVSPDSEIIEEQTHYMSASVPSSPRLPSPSFQKYKRSGVKRGLHFHPLVRGAAVPIPVPQSSPTTAKPSSPFKSLFSRSSSKDEEKLAKKLSNIKL